MARPFQKFFCCSLLLLATPSCIYNEDYRKPPGFTDYNTYGCNGGRQFVASFSPEGDRVSVTDDDFSTVLHRDGGYGPYTGGPWSMSVSDKAVVNIFRDRVPVYENCVSLVRQKPYYKEPRQKYKIYDPRYD